MSKFVLHYLETDFDQRSGYPLFYEWFLQLPVGRMGLGRKPCTYTSTDSVRPTDTDIENAIKSTVASLRYEAELLESFLSKS